MLSPALSLSLLHSTSLLCANPEPHRPRSAPTPASHKKTLLDDPDLPGLQPALPRDFSLEDMARDAEDNFKRRRR